MQATDKDVGAMDGVNGQEGSPSMADSQTEPPQTSNKSQAFDLFNLVISYKRLLLYLEPLTDAWEGIKYLLRWQMPICSLLTCFALNFLLLTLHKGDVLLLPQNRSGNKRCKISGLLLQEEGDSMPQPRRQTVKWAVLWNVTGQNWGYGWDRAGAWFTVSALCIAVPAFLAYLQEISQVHLSEPELARRKFYSVRREDLQKVKLSRQEAVAEVKSFLIQLEGVLSMMCSNCEMVYSLLYWKNPALSFQFYGAILGSVCILYLIPFCWVLAVLNSSLFLGTKDFYRVVGECRAALRQKSNTEPIEAAPDVLDIGDIGGGGIIIDRTSTPTPTSTEDLSPGSVEEAEEADPEEEFKDAIEEDEDVSQCSVEYDLGLQDSGFLSKNEVLRNKVSKLTEKLRKRYPANNFGTCNNCTATFSVLKKRRNCSNCGNSYCSRCCSYKVPKSFMGATAPDAQRETVFVCALCNQTLNKKE
uniref:Protrudin n=1 Tax=Geotrypetes seraphini TaxID=260995 RepID=A0A6P8QSM8_GEOSA|nr:protrudin isoform X2 [Geotrypetes seraphini]